MAKVKAICFNSVISSSVNLLLDFNLLMKNNESLFTEFLSISKEEWLAKIEKDLKGRSIDELNWEPEAGIKISPFFHLEDGKKPATTGDHRQQNHWEIGQYIPFTDAKMANLRTLSALNGGVNAPRFELKSQLTVQALNQLFEGIVPSYISTHFSFLQAGIDPATLWEIFVDFLHQNNIPVAEIKGSFAYDPLAHHNKLDQLIALLSGKEAPHFKFVTIAADPKLGTVEALANMILRGQTYLSQLQDQGIPPSRSHSHLQFSIVQGDHFFIEIAKIRALRLLWLNVLHAYQLDPIAPSIVAHTQAPQSGEDPYQHMIRSATQSMSAVIGGAQRLYVAPADYQQATHESRFADNPDFGPRIARNVQHLLQMESFLDRVIDPAAGSYYIENLTEQLAVKAWEIFQARA